MRLHLLLAATLLALPLVGGCDTARTADSAAAASSDAAALVSPGRIVVANRADGTLSLIDTQTNAVSTVLMPDGGEPMYVVYTRTQDRVFVGDRANDRVVAFDARTFEVDGFIPTGSGVFHMWADRRGRQLWVVGDQDNTLTVADPGSLDVIATISVEGGQPHDVIVNPRGRYAYSTLFVDGGADQVVQYSTQTFQELGRADVGEDPHLSLGLDTDDLYVPGQNSDVVSVLDRVTLAPVTDITVPGAHGAAMSSDDAVFYTTNLPGGGTDGLFAIDTATNTVIGSVDTPEDTPHNLARTPDGELLYVTHSGPNNVVTVYTTSASNPVPVFAATVTVGSNPFGLAYIP